MIGLHPSLLALDTECAVGGGAARAGADDIWAMGPSQVVLSAVVRFAAELRA